MKKSILFASISSLFCFILYLLTVAPEVGFTDSGELAAVCVTLGIAHPSGYPLFTMIGHIWSLLPLPISKIYSLNILSAIFVSSAIFVFFFNCFKLLGYLESKQISKPKSKDNKPSSNNLGEQSKNLIAFLASISLGTATTVWSQATGIEVYSLHLLFLNLIILISINILELNFINFKDNNYHNLLNRNYRIIALLVGLSFTNHLTTILVLPALFYLYFIKEGGKFSINKEKLISLLPLFLITFIGLSIYLYMPLRSASNPMFNWGGVHRSFDKFLYHVSGKQYQVWLFSDSEVFNKNAGTFFSLFPAEFGIVGILSMVYGLFKLFQSFKEIAIYLLVLAIVCALYSFNFSIHDIENYYLLAFTALTLISFIGVYFIAKINRQLLYIFILVPIVNIAMNYKENDESKNYAVSEYTNNLVYNLDKNAIIISSQWDFWVSAFWYKQKVENMRPDVLLVEKELLRRTWYLNQLKQWAPILASQSSAEFDNFGKQLELFESGGGYNTSLIQGYYISLVNSFIDNNIDKRPIYITFEILQNEPGIADKYQKVPQGIAFKLTKNNIPLKVNPDNIKEDKFISSIFNKEYYQKKAIRDIFAESLVNMGRYALMTQDTTNAKKAFLKAKKINPENEYANAGLEQLK